MKREIEIDLSEFIGIRVLHAEGGNLHFDQGSLQTACAWRLHNRKGILVSSDEYSCGETREKASKIFQQELVGTTIRAITIDEVPGDLLIEFDNDLWLDILPLSAQFESWNLKRKHGRQLVCLPGGRVTWFLKEGEY